MTDICNAGPWLVFIPGLSLLPPAPSWIKGSHLLFLPSPVGNVIRKAAFVIFFFLSPDNALIMEAVLRYENVVT